MQSNWENMKVLCVLCLLLTAQLVTADEDWGSYSWWDITCYAVPAAVGGVAVVAAAPVVLGYAGFGVGGVVAHTVAATVQSVAYGGATTGVFSTLTSAGAAGIGAAGNAALFTTGAAAGAAAKYATGGCDVDCE